MSEQRHCRLCASLIVSLPVLLLVMGCANIPRTYQMTPTQVREFRSNLGTVGVAVSEYRSKLEFAAPAKGRIGGLKRGFIAGAVKPVLIGFVAPVPGGTLAGALVAPFTAVAGAAYGVSKTPSQEEVEKAEAGINHALDRLKSQDLGQRSLADFVSLAEERSPFKFIALPGKGPQESDEEVSYDELDLNGVDTVLEVRVEKGGLWGSYDIDPPSVAYLETRIRLVRASDNETLLEDTLLCTGEQRKYLEWGENKGQRFYDSILACIPRIQEKIVSDLFLVYPLPQP